MKENYTDISVVLDRSGSMESIKKDTIGGFNRFLQDQKKVKGECTISLYQFDDKFETVYKGKDLQSAPELNDETFVPRGWTALLDAIGRTINETGNRLLKLPEKDRPSKVCLCIITDGEENTSKEFTKDEVFKMIKHQQDKYNWSVIYLGANQDAINVAKGYGINPNSTLTYAATAKGSSSMYNSLSRSVTSYRDGSSVCCSFSVQDREEQEKELNK